MFHLALVLTLARSEAEPSVRVALLPLGAGQSVDAGTAQIVHEQLEQGLGRGGLEVIPASEIAAAVTSSCADAACIRELASKTGARFVVRPGLVHRDRVYTLELELLDGATGVAVATSHDECDICGRQEVAAVASDQASMLGAKILAQGSGPTTVRVESTPPGASVWIDGEPVGRTPLVREVPPGTHELRIERQGYAPEARRLDTSSGLEHEVNIALASLPPASRAPSKLVVAGAATLASGLAIGIGGAVLLALDERQYHAKCSGNDVDLHGTCRYSYDTMAGGAVLAAVGLASVGAGVAMIVVGKRRTRTVQAAIGPRGVMLYGRF